MIIGIDASRANRVEKTGIEWYAYHLLNTMKKISNFEFRISNFFLYTDTPLANDLANLPAHWHEKLLGWPPRKFWTQGRLSLEMLVRPPDLLFIPSHVIPVIHPKRVVLTCHDIGFERRPELYPKAELVYHRWSMRFGVRAATHIIAVSEFTKQELMDVYGLPSEKISVVHHGFYGGGGLNVECGMQNAELQLSSAQRDIQHSTFNIPNSYLLYVGRIEAKKNLNVIIDAFAELKRAKKIPDDMQLLLVGRLGYQGEKILKQAQQKGKGAIRYLSWVPSETLQELYRHATAFLFPSLYEGFGFPLLEALSYGVPVIASDIPALREIGKDTVIFVTPTIDGFYNAIQAVIGSAPNEAQKKQWTEHIRSFSWENAAKRTLTILHNAVS